MQGKFITFEGIDGCGKTTQLDLLAQHLTAKDIAVVKTKEPGGTQLGNSLRNLLLNDPIALNPYAEVLLFLADRIHHIETIIKPALSKGQWVLSDRFMDSTIAYQGYGRHIDLEWINKVADIQAMQLNPDLTFFIDLSAEESTKRILDKKKDKMESESLVFMQNVRKGFQALAQTHKERIVSIQANQTIEQIAKEIISYINNLHNKHEII